MVRQSWSRRGFLKASLVGAFLLLGRPAFPEIVRPEKPEEGSLVLYNTHTQERLDLCYREASSGYDPAALDALDHFFRCHYTQKVANMDIRVIEFLNAVDKEVGGGHEIHIISGYRSPEYNDLLIREGRDVARHSLHLEGKAIDIHVPHVGLSAVRRAALRLGYGGVGYYPHSGFVHIDSGRFRYW